MGIVCVGCQKEAESRGLSTKGQPKLPWFWKKTPAGPVCTACKKAKTASSVRMYTYGALAPTTEGDEVVRQMRAAHHYYNALVASKRDYYQALREIEVQYSPAIQEIWQVLKANSAALDAIRQGITARNIQEGTRTDATAEEEAQLAGLKQDRKAFWKALNVAENALRKEQPAFVADENRLKAVRKERERQMRLRVKSDVYWGTYLHVEQSGCTKPKARFHPWEDHGHLMVQCQQGLPVATWLAGTDTVLQAVPREHTPPEKSGPARREPGRYYSRGGRRAGQGYMLRFRIGSEGKRKTPRWAEIPVILHRLPPPDARIKACHLLRERVGTVNHWRVSLAVEHASFAVRDDWAQEGTVGIDVGWRHRDDGSRRVAYHKGDAEKDHDELPLGKDVLALVRHSEELQGVRDALLNEAKKHVQSWMDLQPTLPEWLLNATHSLSHWRSPDKLYALLGVWQHNRIAGDGYILQWLRGWREEAWTETGKRRRWFEGFGLQDWHLRNWQAHMRRKARNRRNAMYREYAARLAKTYRTIRMENLDMATGFLRRPLPEEKDKKINRAIAKLAAPGTLITFIRERGAQIEVLEPHLTTRRCSWCGHINTFAEPWKLIQHCDGCDRWWDRDLNAARNIQQGWQATPALIKQCERSDEGKKPGGARKRRKRDLSGGSKD